MPRNEIESRRRCKFSTEWMKFRVFCEFSSDQRSRWRRGSRGAIRPMLALSVSKRWTTPESRLRNVRLGYHTQSQQDDKIRSSDRGANGPRIARFRLPSLVVVPIVSIRRICIQPSMQINKRLQSISISEWQSRVVLIDLTLYSKTYAQRSIIYEFQRTK